MAQVQADTVVHVWKWWWPTDDPPTPPPLSRFGQLLVGMGLSNSELVGWRKR